MDKELSGFVDEICERTTQIRWFFALSMLFLLLNVPYLLVADRGSATFVISTMNAVGFAAFAGVSGLTIRYCRQRD